MTSYRLVVLTNAVQGRDAEFNDWYTNRHIPEVLTVPGFVAAQRFKLAEADTRQESDHQYLAIYEVNTEDLAATKEALSDAVKAGRVFVSTSNDGTAGLARYFEPVTDRIVANSIDTSDSGDLENDSPTQPSER